MLISKDVKYISDYSLQTFTLTSPIKFKNNLKFNVSSSLTQRVYYGKEVQSDTPLSSNPIYGYFVIESTVDSVSELEMQKTSGNYNNLDFGVQILNGVPSSDILLQAKKMLAYDDSLPVFVYSRIGNIELKLDNPYKTEVYEIPKGANVSYVISDWILDFKKGSSSIRNAYVSSSVPVIYGETNHNILKEDVDFTIDTGTGKKIVKVLAVDNSKTVVMDYTPFNVEVEGTAPYKYVLNNLAYEPRAFTLMPQNTKDLCIEFNGKTNLPVNLNNIPGAETAAYMKLYNIEDSGDLNQIQYHDDLLSTSKTRDISDSLILVNYGLNDVQINLNRLDAGGVEVGELYLAPDEESTNTLDFNFISGFISGLNETKNVRAYRFYGDESKFKLNVDSKVYESPSDTQIDDYSILARAFTTNDNPTNRLLGTFNLYLKKKDVKAVPNRWYMAGLADTTFSNLVKGYVKQ